MHDTDGSLPRPRFHLTPTSNWMNDPNGLVFHHGLWHAYYQYNPEGPDWGNMSWGHSTSVDLEHWDEHPVALRHRTEEQVFSGSVVVSSEDELTAYFTSAFPDDRQAQSRAVSRDGGYSWERDAGNPVLDRGTSAFRDPKIIRYTDAEGGFRWIMLAVEADDRQVLFYSSTDLRSWEYLSAFGPIGVQGVVWECPDLVHLSPDELPGDDRWALLVSTNPVGHDADPEGSSMSAVVGRFDGTSFTPERNELRRVDHGRDFYAGVTFDSTPDGSAVLLGWMSNWRYAADIPSSPWRGAMSMPRRLSLRNVDGVPRLVQTPATFIVDRIASATPMIIDAVQPFERALSGHSLVELQWDPVTTGRLQLRLTGAVDAAVEIVHDPDSRALRITRSGPAVDAVHEDFASTSTASLAADRSVRLLLSLDGPLLEAFVNDGEATISNLVLLGASTVTLRLETERDGLVSIASTDVPPRTDEALTALA